MDVRGHDPSLRQHASEMTGYTAVSGGELEQGEVFPAEHRHDDIAQLGGRVPARREVVADSPGLVTREVGVVEAEVEDEIQWVDVRIDVELAGGLPAVFREVV